MLYATYAEACTVLYATTVFNGVMDKSARYCMLLTDKCAQYCVPLSDKAAMLFAKGKEQH